MNSRCQPNKAGFTLIEVLIVMLILVMIGTLTAKSIVESAKLKVTLTEETDFSNGLRTSLGFIERDLNQVFNPRWFLPVDHRPLDPFAPPVPPPTTGATTTLSIEEINRRSRNTAFNTYEFWGPILSTSGIRASRFKGSDKEMSFVSASHVRVYGQKKESIYAKIRYQYTDGTLYKIWNTHAFELEEPKEAKYVTTDIILTKLKSFRFRYYRSGEPEPLRDWDSQSRDGKAPIGMFPEAVEMEFEVEATQGKVVAQKVLLKLETPNDALPTTY